jgi:hypothetical protein
METSLMSESVVDADDVEETVTQVLTHFVEGGVEEPAMSVQLLQEQVELHLEYAAGSLKRIWVIITEISKEVENNTISRVNVYQRQYVPRRNVVAGGSNVGGGSSGRS